MMGQGGRQDDGVRGRGGGGAGALIRLAGAANDGGMCALCDAPPTLRIHVGTFHDPPPTHTHTRTHTCMWVCLMT